MGWWVMWIAVLYLVVDKTPLMSDTQTKVYNWWSRKADLAKGHFVNWQTMIMIKEWGQFSVFQKQGGCQYSPNRVDKEESVKCGLREVGWQVLFQINILNMCTFFLVWTKCGHLFSRCRARLGRGRKQRTSICKFFLCPFKMLGSSSQPFVSSWFYHPEISFSKTWKATTSSLESTSRKIEPLSVSVRAQEPYFWEYRNSKHKWSNQNDQFYFNAFYNFL